VSCYVLAARVVAASQRNARVNPLKIIMSATETNQRLRHAKLYKPHRGDVPINAITNRCPPKQANARQPSSTPDAWRRQPQQTKASACTAQTRSTACQRWVQAKLPANFHRKQRHKYTCRGNRKHVPKPGERREEMNYPRRPHGATATTLFAQPAKRAKVGVQEQHGTNASPRCPAPGTA